MSTLYWTFTAMALILLKIGGENQLGVFSSSGSFVYNYVTAVFLFLGILLTVPFFMAADWAKDGQDFIETQWKKEASCSNHFQRGVCGRGKVLGHSETSNSNLPPEISRDPG